MMKSMRSVASGLRKRGFKTGDSLLVTIAPNKIELPLVAFGVQRAGGFQTNLDPGYLLAGMNIVTIYCKQSSIDILLF